MLKKLTFLLLFFCIGVMADDGYRFSLPFNSVFKNLNSGKFSGTVNGVLIVINQNGKKMLLDFQGSPCELNITEDEEEIYDCSTKSYTGKTTSGKTEVMFTYYGLANSFGIRLKGIRFSKSMIDGACDAILKGLDYYFIAEKSSEYLIIHFTDDLEISNRSYLLEETKVGFDEDDLEKITIKKNSSLVFVINRI